MKKKILLTTLLLALLILFMLSVTSVAFGDANYWIDLTEDKSITHITGQILVAGEAGIQAGYAKEKTVYSADVPVTYGTPVTSEVKAKIAECSDKVDSIVKDIQSLGNGRIGINEPSKTTRDDWDHRRYDSYGTYLRTEKASDDSVICHICKFTLNSEEKEIAITDSANKDQVSKKYPYCWVDNDFRTNLADPANTRYIIAIGDYGKETDIMIEAIGVVEGFDIDIVCEGNGGVRASAESALKGTEITLSAFPGFGFKFREWQVLSGDVTITDNKFKVGSSNVVIKAIFEEEPSDHTFEEESSDQIILEKLSLKTKFKDLKLVCQKNSIKVSWTKLTKKDLKTAKNIEIQISTDKKFRKDVTTNTLSAKKSSFTFKKLKPGKKYYVRIRAFTLDGNIKNVSKWYKKSAKLSK